MKFWKNTSTGIFNSKTKNEIRIHLPIHLLCNSNKHLCTRNHLPWQNHPRRRRLSDADQNQIIGHPPHPLLFPSRLRFRFIGGFPSTKRNLHADESGTGGVEGCKHWAETKIDRDQHLGFSSGANDHLPRVAKSRLL